MNKQRIFSVPKIVWMSLALNSLKLLDVRGRKRVLLATLALSCLAVIDVLAIGLVGLLSLMTLNGISSGTKSNKVSKLLEVLHIEKFDFQVQAMALASTIAIILIARTYISAFVNQRMLKFLSSQSVRISKSMISNVLKRDTNTVKNLSRTNINYGLSEGVDRIVVGVLGSLINIGSDFALIAILVMTLNLVDIVLGMTSIIFFGFIGIAIYARQGNVSARLGKVLVKKRTEIADKLFGSIDSLREVQLRGTLQEKIDEMVSLRAEQSAAWAQLSFQPYMAKYYLEIGMVVGGIIVGGAQFIVHDAKHAVGLLSLFLAAGVRIIPSILRLHSSLINIRSSAGVASITLELLNLPLQQAPITNSSKEKKAAINDGVIRFDDVSFSYSESNEETISNLSLDINRHELTAFVGPSGSGKSTLFDLALGFSVPQSGEVTIAGLDPRIFVSQNPGVVSIVPQEVSISKSTLRENLLLGYDTKLSDEEIIAILKQLNLLEFFESLPLGLESDLGEFGSRLSGGQKQRIGIARAICTQPDYLFLDEATSSLDATTEHAVMEFLQNMKSKITIIVIAHRLSTVQNADRVIYFDAGRVIGSGTFTEVRSQVPSFEIQAGLLGIN